MNCDERAARASLVSSFVKCRGWRQFRLCVRIAAIGLTGGYHAAGEELLAESPRTRVQVIFFVTDA